VQQVSAENNRLYRILEDANVKLSTVIKADSASGKKIINAMINGETNLEYLLRFIHGKTKASRQEISKALEGNLSDHHRFMLKTIRQSIQDKEILIASLDKQIDQMASRYAIEIDLLNTIDGVGRDSAIAIISEIGTDMSRFPNEHHLSSLGGMSPGNNESAGKKKAQKPSKGISILG
jgi:transposase